MAQLRGGTTIGGHTAWHAGNFQPNTKLDIAGGIMTGGLTITQSANVPGITLSGATSGWASGIQLNNTTAITGHMYGIYSNSAGSLAISDETAAAARMIINSDGNVLLYGGIYLSDNRVDDKWNAAYTHSQAAHAPSDAPSNATFTGHTDNTAVHVAASERTNWNAAKVHADSTHAPSDAPSNTTFTGHTGSADAHHSQVHDIAGSDHTGMLSIAKGGSGASSMADMPAEATAVMYNGTKMGTRELGSMAFANTADYDKYSNWNLWVGGTKQLTVGSNADVKFLAGDNVNLSYANNTVTIGVSAGADKYLSSVSGTCGGTVTFTLSDSSTTTWNSSHTHSYLPLSGGTITSNLRVNGGLGIATDPGSYKLNVVGASSFSGNILLVQTSNVTLGSDTTSGVNSGVRQYTTVDGSKVWLNFRATGGIALRGDALASPTIEPELRVYEKGFAPTNYIGITSNAITTSATTLNLGVNGSTVLTINSAGAITIGTIPASSVTSPPWITSSGVTYANLNANGSVGTGSSQVARGDHTHSVYEPTISNGTANYLLGMNSSANAKEWKQLATGTSGTAPAFTHAAGSVTLNIPLASTTGVTAGLISKSEYDSFNSRAASSHGDGNHTSLSYFNALTDGSTTSSASTSRRNIKLVGSSGMSIAISGDTSNAIATVSPTYGATANTVAQGNDSRFHDPGLSGHSWANQNLLTTSAPTFAGLTINTGDVVVPDGKIKLSRSKGVAAGGHGISWYNDTYYTWYDYMSNPVSGAAPSGAAAPSGSLVTSWARRFNVESASGYGWIFESGASSSGSAPVVKFEIRSSDGAWRSAGGGTVNGTLNATTLQQGGTGVCLTTDSRLSNARTPTAHAVNASTYGYGNTTNAGHLRVGAGLSVSSGTVSANFGTATNTICQGNDSRLSDARTPTAHAVNAATYGYGDATNAGHLRVGTGLSISSGTVSVSYGTSSGTACVGNDARLSDPRTPLSHGNEKHSVAYITATDGDSRYLQKSGGSLTGYITLHSDPTSDMHPATKVYVDSMAQGLQPKEACRVATTANITLSGTQTIDNVALGVGDRVLVKNQSTASQNGPYVVASSTWARAADANSSDKVKPGMYMWVTEGNINADTGWVLTTNAPITLGTTALTFEQFTGAGQILTGDGLDKTGNMLYVVFGDTGKTVCDGADPRLSDARTPTAHAVNAATYGYGDTTNAGHLRVGTGLNISSGTVSVAYGTEVNTACQGNDARLSDTRVPIAHAVNASTYGYGDTINAGHLRVGTGISLSSGTISVTYGTASNTACQGNDSRLSNARTPLPHTHVAADLPAASTAQAGIVQLSTATNNTSTVLAATASAVKAAYDKGDHDHPYAPTSHSHVAGDLPSASTTAAGIVQLSNVTNSTSTVLAATANAVKTAYDKGDHSHPYVSTSGGAMTGALIMNTGNYVYLAPAASAAGASSVTGTCKITLPKSWSNTMMRMRIVGYDYSGNAAWEADVSGYNYTGGWVNTSATVYGSPPFNTVRLAHDGTRCCILLGTTATVWKYPTVVVEKLVASYGAQSGWDTGWSIGFISSESGITSIVTPTFKKCCYIGDVMLEPRTSDPSSPVTGQMWLRTDLT